MVRFHSTKGTLVPGGVDDDFVVLGATHRPSRPAVRVVPELSNQDVERLAVERRQDQRRYETSLRYDDAVEAEYRRSQRPTPKPREWPDVIGSDGLIWPTVEVTPPVEVNTSKSRTPIYTTADGPLPLPEGVDRWVYVGRSDQHGVDGVWFCEIVNDRTVMTDITKRFEQLIDDVARRPRKRKRRPS
jgi:hypothetical protein